MNGLVVPATVLHNTPRSLARLVAQLESCNDAVIKFLVSPVFILSSIIFVAYRARLRSTFDVFAPIPSNVIGHERHLFRCTENLAELNFAILPRRRFPCNFQFRFIGCDRARALASTLKKVTDDSTKRRDNLSTSFPLFFFRLRGTQLRHYF